ncbi:MAG: oligosaccharide flippase family protein [Microcystis sp. M54BS1]|uniref:lipopolysaccharide biosynthesis protein n=1 Tax=unclassified Microcystis TaxID=2643300 RepID=UPI001D66F6D7|nr:MULTISPECIES: oligosaccharide flippase family protein [unclassified Microcystis]MBE5230951.1 oligosaccharide flippase family protein [Microcystis aeruginosa PMC 728.11]MCA2540638.1 oligosaccharide flippase family protein [Microcystis sp. M54BS1]MCA2594746.1 oligosaccharide flippase family protein [Microcystis sp. M38BS1]MCA2609515.1 oligosaccharide flippase family protein [Microcystis sp. M27BS1]MCA2507556.1 oligosaccharide flippase family protein [Microcystis sp. M62BS1]
MSDLLAKAVNNSKWTAIGSLMTAILGFLFAGLTIRWLGEAEAGFAIAIAAIVGINNTFSGLGLGTAAIRLISRAYEENNSQEIQKIAGVCFTTSLAFGLFGFCLFTFGSSWIVQWSKYEGNADTGRLYVILLGSAFLLQQITGYFSIFLSSLQRFDWQTKLSTTFLLANGILGITLLKAFPNILTLGIIQLALSCLNCLCTGFIVTKILGFLTRPSWHQAMFIELWSFGKWVYLTQIKAVFFDGFDKIFLTSVFGSSSLPFYTFGQRIYLTVHGMLAGQSSYLFPMLSSQGDKLDKVAEQIEERMRWFIGLLAAFIYSGLIIAGPAILTKLVNAEFASQASFQLFIFCWVGYNHGNAIVPFIFGLSKGDAKGNWIYHMIIGLGSLPFVVLFALVFGFQYAVIGQLMTLVGTIYLSRRLKPKMDLIAFSSWLIRPLYSSLLLMFIASGVHLMLNIEKANSMIQIASIAVFYLAAILLIPRLEIAYLGYGYYWKTLGKAISLFLIKFGISDKLLFRFLGIGDIINTNIKYK